MRRVAIYIAAAILLLALLAIVIAHWIDEPLRRKMERDMNQALKGYTVRIGSVDFHPIGFSLDLEDSTIYQNAHPDPPVAHIPNLSASVNWKALLFGRVVADFEINEPKVFINLKQTEKEIDDKTPMKERGWQEAVQAIYPLQINEFVISSGDFTYQDEGPFPPLHLRNLYFRAENIRNVRSEPGSYPSPVRLEGSVFEKGKLTLDGRADFLAEPHVAFKATMGLEQIDLQYFKPILARYQIMVRQGVLSGAGSVEYAAHTKIIEIPHVAVQGAQAEYVHEKKTTSPTEEIGKKTHRAAKEYGNKPDLVVRIDRVTIADSQLGFVNKAADPHYRVFIADAEIKLENFSNHLEHGVAVGRASGNFMGSGKTRIVSRFRPNEKGPDLDLNVAIDGTDMRAMNDMLRAYGKIDVTEGVFSFYSEISVKNGSIQGYVKPLFRDLDIYDKRQDRDKNLFQKIYEGIIGGLSWVLENEPRDEVATQTEISGQLSNPETSTFDVVIGLVQNAFFKAILPGLEREIRAERKR